MGSFYHHNKMRELALARTDEQKVAIEAKYQPWKNYKRDQECSMCIRHLGSMWVRAKEPHEYLVTLQARAINSTGRWLDGGEIVKLVLKDGVEYDIISMRTKSGSWHGDKVRKYKHRVTVTFDIETKTEAALHVIRESIRSRAEYEVNMHRPFKTRKVIYNLVEETI